MANEQHAGAILRHLERLVETETQRGCSDGQLLQRFAMQREEEAFAALVRRHGRLVWGVCRHILRHEQDAADAFQATFLVLARRAAAVRKFESIGSWLHGVAYRVAVRAKRTAAKRRQRERLAAVPEATPVPADLAWRELQALLDEEVARLSERYRAPFVLCCLEGRSRAEAAAALGLPKGTVSSRIAHARRLLQERLARRGVTLSAALTAGVLWGRTASAAVPAALVRTTVASAASRTARPITPAVAALADGAGRMLSAAKAFMGLILVLAATAVGVIGYGLCTATPSLNDQPEHADNLSAPAPPERLDLYGDPLPPEAVTRLGTTRFSCGPHRHTQVAFSPTGRTILAAGWHGVSIFDAATGKQLRYNSTLTAKRNINSMSLSPNGKHLAVGLESETDGAQSVQIWDLETGQLLRECRDTGRQQYLNVRFSPDGKMLGSYSYPAKAVYLWDPATGREIRRWPVASKVYSCFTFSPDSKTLIVGDMRTIHFWDIATGTEVQRIGNHPGVSVYRLALTPDGKILATQEALEHDPGAEPRDMRDNKVHLWDAASGKRICDIEVVGDSSTKQAKRLPGFDLSVVKDFLFSHDSKALVTASGDGVLRVLDVTTGKELHHWDTAGGINTIALSPDGKTLATLGIGNTVRLWDTATGRELREHPSHDTGFQFLALSPDGHTLASAGWGEDVRLWDTATGQPQRRLNTPARYVYALHFSADGRTLTTLGDDNQARIWDLATGNELRHFPVPIEGRRRQHALSPDGKTWVSVSEKAWNNNHLVLWDAATGKKRQILNQSWVNAFAFSPDSTALYSWSQNGSDKRVRIWNLATGKRLREFPADDQQKDVYMGSFSPDGNWFACGGGESVLLLYALATGNAVRRIEVPAMHYENRTLTFSPDSRTLAVGDEEGTVHLLEVASGKFRRHLVGGHHESITALAFSPDSKRLISGSSDTTALIWDLTGGLSARRVPLREADLDACWTDLAGTDAERAYRAIHRLAASPTEMVPYLEKRLRPGARVDARRVEQLITDLGSDRFAVRDQATKELEKLGDAAIALCRKALADNPPLEQRRRLARLVEKEEQERWSPSPERLRTLRALEALEFAGTPAARRLLQKLAAGALEASRTQEAKAALERLARRPGRES
jgi:RNA polymerase sigma factor (sigma-70 family)